jgi:2-oxoisovalerate dehydrogenase E1 component
MRDLNAEKDGAWMSVYPEPGVSIPLGEVGVHGRGKDLAIVSFANGYYLSRQALSQIEKQGVKARVIDIRWLSPLPREALVAATKDVGRILIVDETRRTGGVADSLFTMFTEDTDAKVARVCAEDSFIATGPAYAATMPSADDIVKASLDLIGKKS